MGNPLLNIGMDSNRSQFMARQRIESQINLPRLFAVIDADPSIVGAGVVYIDADCLVLEDVSEVRGAGSSADRPIATLSPSSHYSRGQLFELDADLAAAPDVFPPDRFNAGAGQSKD